jgi:hypothetical protein
MGRGELCLPACLPQVGKQTAGNNKQQQQPKNKPPTKPKPTQLIS